MLTDAAGERRAAWTAGLSSYLIWGFLPLAMQAMAAAGAGSWEILAHRVLWGAVAAGVFVLIAKQGGQVARVLREPKTVAFLVLSSVLIAANWITFIWATTSGRVLQTSLGYYIIPLVNMAAGALVFRERLSRMALIAIALAAIGVVLQGVALGRLPVASLVIALSFGGYGIVRKQVAADAQTGLFVECLLMSLPAAAVLIWLAQHGQSHFGREVSVSLWLMAAGPITAVPLTLFAWAARRLPLSGMGFLQFLAPTMSFAIGLAEGESFRALHAASFVFIWAGAAVYMAGAVIAARRVQRLA